MGSVRTSILGKPRRLPGDRRADVLYADHTVICEEPAILQTRRVGESLLKDLLSTGRDALPLTLGRRPRNHFRRPDGTSAPWFVRP